ncbi:MAG: acetate--CoA ligase family protein [Roseovarius sp.]|nr:acetate--CoA ligase family protein [Roseovarius sp.]MCY4315045.1 acetate--CoA ligase family protein [Roseovarius sp.]
MSGARNPLAETPEFWMPGEVKSKALVEKYGLRVPTGALLSPANPDFDALGRLSFPVAMKILSPDIVHKSDGGFVALALQSVDDVRAAFEKMRLQASRIGAPVQGYLVEEMVPKGVEVVVGGVADPSFGPMIMFGLGGIYVEVFRDVSFRICPICRADAEDMINALASRPILEGARGGVAADREALVDLLLRVGGEEGILMRERAIMQELDLNPVIINDDRCVVVDARVVLKESQANAR